MVKLLLGRCSKPKKWRHKNNKKRETWCCEVQRLTWSVILRCIDFYQTSFKTQWDAFTSATESLDCAAALYKEQSKRQRMGRSAEDSGLLIYLLGGGHSFPSLHVLTVLIIIFLTCISGSVWARSPQPGAPAFCRHKARSQTRTYPPIMQSHPHTDGGLVINRHKVFTCGDEHMVRY